MEQLIEWAKWFSFSAMTMLFLINGIPKMQFFLKGRPFFILVF